MGFPVLLYRVQGRDLFFLWGGGAPLFFALAPLQKWAQRAASPLLTPREQPAVFFFPPLSSGAIWDGWCISCQIGSARCYPPEAKAGAVPLFFLFFFLPCSPSRTDIDRLFPLRCFKQSVESPRLFVAIEGRTLFPPFPL